LALRQTEGLIGSIIGLLGLDLATPDHSTLSRRAETLQGLPRPRSGAEPVHLLVDSTDLKNERRRRVAGREARREIATQSGYNWRALVEAAIGRYKRVIGDGLRSQTDRRRATEIAIAVGALNRMLEFGRPISVRIR
jgi:hypothetical protein